MKVLVVILFYEKSRQTAVLSHFKSMIFLVKLNFEVVVNYFHCKTGFVRRHNPVLPVKYGERHCGDVV